MTQGWPRDAWRGFLRLLFAFGLWGLVVWPVTGWLGGSLIQREISRLDSHLHTGPSSLIGRDFVNIWHGGHEAIAHGAGVVYDREAYRRTLYPETGLVGFYTFSYPPHMLLLSLPFGLTGYLVSLALWSFLGLALFWHAARPWLRDVRLPGWAVLVLPAAIVNIWAGHFGFLIGALALYGWRTAQTHPARSALAFAVMTVKPHMGILIPVILAMKRQWRTILLSGAGMVALVGLSALVFGLDSWSIWLSSTLAFQAGLIEIVPRQPYSFMMPTVGRMLYAVTTDEMLVALGQIMIGVYAVIAIYWAHTRRVGTRDLGLLSLIAIPLILPYSFTYDMVAMCLVALVCAVRWGRWYGWQKLVFAGGFLVPLAQAPLAREGFWPAPIALILMLGVAAWRMAREARGAAPAAQQAVEKMVRAG